MDKYQRVIDDLSKEAQWIGEEGSAVCYAKTSEDALVMFRKILAENVSDEEAAKIGLGNIGKAWLHFPEVEEGEPEPEDDWFVSLKAPSNFWVWFLHDDY